MSLRTRKSTRNTLGQIAAERQHVTRSSFLEAETQCGDK